MGTGIGDRYWRQVLETGIGDRYWGTDIGGQVLGTGIRDRFSMKIGIGERYSIEDRY